MLAGCKVDTTVTVSMQEDGSGVVKVTAVLDAGAVRSAEAGGGKLEDRVRVADLTQHGWTVSTWTRAENGTATLTFTKPFANPAQATEILREISGTTGPLRDMQVTRSRGTFATDYAVTGKIDLAGLGTGITADEQLVQSLTAQRVDLAALDQSLLAAARDAVSVQVVAELPDDTTTAIGSAGKVVPVDATSTVRDGRKLGLVAAAVVIVAVAVTVLSWPTRRRAHSPSARRGTPRAR